ncbi:MAG: hypothetical protein Harvfovirus24_15 [Harvfovirus sp.]|uniref:Uncharacterized protein n=1 Tax=Harvfovirus sp. TaxID=2487768 RepID=A0A3G5A744_9VIRU|nr:MAG: hypothetical protein Harvfovirus24_15 [Harvfovirus sp.]
MKIYGLFKVINKGNNNTDSFALFNLLHPDKKLNAVSSFVTDEKYKTFFSFFYEDNPYMNVSSIDSQYIEYNKFKRDMEQLINKKNLSMYENDTIGKMVSRLAVAENKYMKYKEKMSVMDARESDNQVIIDELYDSQTVYAKNIDKYVDMCYEFNEFKDDLSEEIKDNNFKMLFDLDNVDILNYDDTIMYPDSCVSFYRTGVVVENGSVVIDDASRIEYVVFELEKDESDESFFIEKEETFVESTVKKIMVLCNDIGIEVPDVIKNRVGERPLKYDYQGRKLIIYRVEAEELQVKFSFINAGLQ